MLVVVVSLPLFILIGVVIALLTSALRETQNNNLMNATRVLAASLNGLIDRHAAKGQALAAMPSVSDPDLKGFRADVARIFGSGENWITVSDLEGRPLAATWIADGADLPTRRPAGASASQSRAFARHGPAISDVHFGERLKLCVVTLDIPVFRDDKPYRILAISFPAHEVRALLDAQKLPAGWIGGVIDSKGNRVARAPDIAGTTGKPAAPGWLAVRHLDGLSRFQSADGVDVVNANLVMAGDWAVGIGVDRAVLEAPVWRTIRWTLMFALATLALASLLAHMFASRIIGSLRELRDKAAALVDGRHPTLAGSPPTEVESVWRSLAAAVDDRLVAERELRLINDELSHRVKNTLAIVRSLASQTMRSSNSPAEFSQFFNQRLGALSRAHNLLIHGAWRGAALADIVREATHDFGDAIAMSGPSVTVSPEDTIALSLLLNELASNARRHGALRAPQGSVAVYWHVQGERLKLVWREHGGPATSAPHQQGFGLRLIQMSARQIDGEIEMRFAREGFHATLNMPAPRKSQTTSAPAFS